MQRLASLKYFLAAALLLLSWGCAHITYDPGRGGLLRSEPTTRIRQDALLLEKDVKAVQQGLPPGSVPALEWEEGESNTFLVSVSRVLEYRDLSDDYNWLSGISGAAFRFQFHEGWCPSALDATVGYGISPYLFDALGFSYLYMVEDKKGANRDAMRDAMAETLQNDYPVIAIELAGTTEWGLVTGMQKKNRELLCRTFFDQGDPSVYRVAEKFPWTILLVEEESFPLPKQNSVTRSIAVAHHMNSLEHAGEYLLGTTGIRAWIDKLENENFNAKNRTELEVVMLTNGRLFRSLRDDRLHAAEYLNRILPLLPEQERKVRELEDLFASTSRILSRSEIHVPYPWELSSLSNWSPASRGKQVEALELVLVNETRCAELLAQIADKLGFNN